VKFPRESALKSLGSDTGVKKEDAPRLTVIGRSSSSHLSELYLRLGSIGASLLTSFAVPI